MYICDDPRKARWTWNLYFCDASWWGCPLLVCQLVWAGNKEVTANSSSWPSPTLRCTFPPVSVFSGYVHSVSSPLFSLGEPVSPGVKQFAETGLTDVLERETVNKTFLDAVLAPPIPVGEGETNTTIFVDTSHTKVSVKSFDIAWHNKASFQPWPFWKIYTMRRLS